MKHIAELIPHLQSVESLSIIGLYKNVGKTTTLNAIIDLMWDVRVLGLTSIGLDGEEEDQIFSRFIY